MTTVGAAREGAVAVLTLDRPGRLNAIDGNLLSDLRSALAAAHAEDAVRAIVLAGAGRAFCAGDDLEDFARQAASRAAAEAHVRGIQEVSRLLLLGPKPAVAAVHGWAVGGGLEWMIDCDLAIVAEGTRFVFPELAWGLLPTGGATLLLPRLVGLAKARELLLLGERFDAAAALGMGLAAKVVPEADLMREATATARRLAELPSSAVAALRRALALGLAGGIEEALARETEATVAAFLDPATAARVAAFARRG
jgi:enoyl-CoA hydratase/carnithine racemase